MSEHKYTESRICSALARLASLRMWDAYAARDSAAAELQRQLAVNTQTVIS